MRPPSPPSAAPQPDAPPRTAAPTDDLSGKMARGGVWVVSARMVMRLSGLINVIVLARLLPPADFGVVGLTVALIGTFEALSDMSIQAAIVRHPDPKRRHYDTAFTFGVLRGLLIAALALMAAEPLAAFYGDERLVYVAWALAAQQAIFGLTNTGTADFQREFTFGRDFAYMATRKLAGSVVSIAVALTVWPDYRALVAGLLAGAVASVIASFVLHPYRPRLGLGAFSELFAFSKWMLVANALDFVWRRCDAFVLGKTLGLTALGIHTLALELANLVAHDFAMPLRRATMPGFARLQDAKAALRAQFSAAYGACMTIAVPFAVGVALVSDAAIRLAFGAEWAAAADPLKVLSLYGLLGASVQFCWPLIVSMGEPRRFAPLQTASLAVGIPLIWWASLEGGLVGAALAMGAMGGAFAYGVLRTSMDLVEGGWGDVLDWAPRSLAAAGAMALAVLGVQALLPAPETVPTAALTLLASMVVGALSYGVALVALWSMAGRPEGAEARILRMARRALPGRGAPAA